MKKILLLVTALLALNPIINAQERILKKVLELQITDSLGANAASVAWHPIQKKYYAAMAGNTNHQMGIYDLKGKMIGKTPQTTLFDVRGLWYNPHTKMLQANGYRDNGWTEYQLSSTGFPVSIKALFTKMNQPDDQSVGGYDPKNNVVYFFDAETGNIAQHNFNDAYFDSSIELHLGYENKQDMDDGLAGDNDDAESNYNSTTIIYTGVKGAEVGLLNTNDKQVELYNLADGFLHQKLILPDDAPLPNFLNFSFTNGIYWLFDNKTRAWKGYK